MIKKQPRWGYWLGWASWVLSAFWVALCLSYALHQIGLRGLLDLAPQEIGEFLAGTVSLPIFLWMVVGHWQRLEAMKATTTRLQEQLDALLDPSASKSANHLMASLQQQTDTLKTASHNAIDTLRGIRGLLHQEAEAFSKLTNKSAAQFEAINSSLDERTKVLNVVSEKAETTSQQVLNSLATLETSASRVDQLSQTIETRATILGGLGSRISEQLDKGSATVEENLKQMAAMTGRFSEQQKDLSDTGKSIAADFRNVSDQVALSTGEIYDWLNQWAATGRQISVETKTLEETLKQRTEALDGTVASLGQMTKQAVTTVDRLVESGERFAQTRLDFDAGLKSVGQRLDEAAGKLDGQITIINSAEQRLGDHLQTVHSALGKARTEHEGLTQTVQILSERTGGAIERLESLRAVSTNGVEDIVFQSERLQRQTSALETDLNKSAGLVAGVLSQMAHVGQTVEQASSQLDAQTERANEALARTRDGLEKASRDISLQGSIVAARSSDTVATLSEASGRITEIAAASMTQLQDVALGLERVNNEVAVNADKASLRATGAADILRASAAEIQAVVNQVDNATMEACQAVNELVVNGGLVRSTVGDAAGIAKGAAADFGEAVTAMANAAQQGRQDLGSLTEQLRIENDMIFRTINRVAEIDGALRNSGAFVNEIAERARQTIVEVQGGVEKVGQEINVQTVTAAEKFSITNEILNRTRDELDRVVNKVDSTFGTLNRKAGEINFVVSTSVNRLGEMSKSIEHAKTTIEDSTNAVTAKLVDAAATMRTEFADVKTTADSVADSLGRTVAHIEAGAARAATSNQLAEAQLNETLRLVERRGETFATAVTLATDSLDHADRAFTEKQREVSLLIEETGGRFDRLSKDMARQSAMLGDAAGSAAEQLMSASADIEGRVSSIGDTVEDAKTVLQGFSAGAGAIAADTLAAAQNIAVQEQTLRGAIVRLGAIADDVESDLTKSAEALSNSAVDLSGAAGHAKGEIIGADRRTERAE